MLTRDPLAAAIGALDNLKGKLKEIFKKKKKTEGEASKPAATTTPADTKPTTTDAAPAAAPASTSFSLSLPPRTSLVLFALLGSSSATPGTEPC